MLATFAKNVIVFIIGLVTSALCAPIFLVVSKAHILIAIENAETEILCTKNGKKP